MQKLDDSELKSWFSQQSVVQHYGEAAVSLGLWASEELVFQRVFQSNQTLLEVGCGAGRICLGLWELGFRSIMGTDLSREMIKEARRIAAKLDYSVPLRVADARKLGFEDGIFDGVIFGFNGLMQIPRRSERRRALAEMRRVVRPRGRLVFTTHDRNHGGQPGYWDEERKRWDAGKQDLRLHEFGDLILEDDHGPVYIHIPLRETVREDLTATGWTWREDALRSDIVAESPAVQAFSTDCRFWVAENSD